MKKQSKTPDATKPVAPTSNKTTFALLVIAVLLLLFSCCPTASRTGQLVCGISGGTIAIACAIRTWGADSVRAAINALVDAFNRLK